jgi:pimeloyl-ACP methyl ester carboxylesterase
VLERLDHRSAAASPQLGRAGDIGLTRIVTTGADGVPRVSWVVDLPGTKQWQPLPGPRPGLNDLASNLELMAGTPNGRVAAVEQILREAGVAVHEPVLLVGHSQGGMVAMRAAQELHGRYAVSHVVTAGSPVGGMVPPPGVQVLALENRYDIVPLADGKDNREGQLTVVFEHQTGTVTGNHGTFSAYVPAAHALDGSAHQAVRAWLDGAEAFLAGDGEQTTASTTVYTVTNGDSR